MKIVHKAHPELYVHLVDLLQYKLKFIVNTILQTLDELAMDAESPEARNMEDLISDMTISDSTLQISISLPPKARF